MKVNFKAKTTNAFLGISEERCQILTDEIKEELKKSIKEGTVRIIPIMNNIITSIRKEHLNTNIEVSSYELELFFQGYLLGRLTTQEYLTALECQLMQECK